MKKELIIDGYNVLGVMKNAGLVDGMSLEAAREAMMQALLRYHFRSGHRLTVVFDAWRQSHRVTQTEHRSGVTVIFTRQGERADDVVQRLIRAHGATCVVVSSDHEIIDTARAHGALVLRSEEFFRKLVSEEAPSRLGRKPSRPLVEGEEAEYERERRPDKRGNPRKLPKKVRQRLRALKKF